LGAVADDPAPSVSVGGRAPGIGGVRQFKI
jgi:hypothetical protein